MVVETNAVPGRDAEFNSWYQEIHLPEVLAAPGFKSARRYRRVDEGGAHTYLAIYEITAASAEAANAALTAAAPAMRMSDALDLAGVRMTMFEATGERVDSREPAGV